MVSEQFSILTECTLIYFAKNARMLNEEDLCTSGEFVEQFEYPFHGLLR